MTGRIAARAAAVLLAITGAGFALVTLASVDWIDGGPTQRTTEQQFSVSESPTMTIHLGGGELAVETGTPGRLSVAS